MNPLWKKEIRLLLPGWLGILFLEMLQPWLLGNEADMTFGMAPVGLFFGMAILAVDSFGREFSLGTFQSLLAQPVERRQIWRTKMAVLFLGSFLIFLAYFASCSLRLREGVATVWQSDLFITNRFDQAMLASGAVLLVALTGGLWTTLLLRQISSAFWMTFLAPLAVVTGFTVIMPQFFDSTPDSVLILVLYCVSLVYSGLGLWWAHRLFHRAQDVAWTGGEISFSRWRYFETTAKSVTFIRHWQPTKALFKKELQLQSISLFCAVALLVLHVGVIFMRVWYVSFHKNSFAEVLSDCFWALWLVMPLILGAAAVAEERKLGVADLQSCLAVSRRWQFILKFVPNLILSILLGAVMPLLVESVAAHFGAAGEIFKPTIPNTNEFISDFAALELTVVGLASGFYLAAFFGSTLTKSFLQALSVAIVILIGGCLSSALLPYLGDARAPVFGILPWPPVLLLLFVMPTAIVLFVWVSFNNFSLFREPARLWRRNIGGLIVAIILIFTTSAFTYNRAWEVFEPAPPVHGATKLSLASPPVLHNHFGNIVVQLANGRVWYDTVWDPMQKQSFWRRLVWWGQASQIPASIGPHAFVEGSNWVSLVAGQTEWVNGFGPVSNPGVKVDIVGVKQDGTAWISAPANGNWTGSSLQQFGNETDWKEAAYASWSVLGKVFLLKTNGMIWRLSWTNRPAARTFSLSQIGTNSDWQAFYDFGSTIIKKNDGSAWIDREALKGGSDRFERVTNFDELPSRYVSFGNAAAYIATNQTLRIESYTGNGYVQAGQEADWAGVAITDSRLVAIKADGTLWQWKLDNATETTTDGPPMRLGTHSDWVGVVGYWTGVIAMAADGSLWFWQNPEAYQDSLLKAQKQPRYLGNVLTERTK